MKNGDFDIIHKRMYGSLFNRNNLSVLSEPLCCPILIKRLFKKKVGVQALPVVVMKRKPGAAGKICRGNTRCLGKDAPGSPLTGAERFPENGIAWDFNYRGDLLFLRQARAHAAARRLRVEDGWVYFIHGWTRVIAEVFHCDIPSEGPEFETLSRLAAGMRSGGA